MGLLAKWAAHWDPIQLGWTPAGIANCMPATAGVMFPRVEGGYNLYHGTDRDDVTEIVGAVGHAATQVQPFTWSHFEPGTHYFRCLPIGSGGVEAVDVDQIVEVTIDDGGATSPVPPPPRDLAVSAIAGGAFRVTWLYSPSVHFADVDEFRIYSDGGSGTMDYDTPVGTVSASALRRGAGAYAFDSDGFDHGTLVTFGVRSATADGDEEANGVTASERADAVGPADYQISAISLGDDE